MQHTSMHLHFRGWELLTSWKVTHMHNSIPVGQASILDNCLFNSYRISLNQINWWVYLIKEKREHKRINGNSLLLNCSLSPSIVAGNTYMHKHTSAHTHLSKETIEDGKWVGCCQNGRLLFTNLIILFSSWRMRWVITPPVSKSHGWCEIHTLVGMDNSSW